MADPLLTLPVVPAEPAGVAAANWHGLTPAEPLERGETAAAPPEPDLPQGAYQPDGAEPVWSAPLTAKDNPAHPVELLAPAGGPDAAYAAFTGRTAKPLFVAMKK
jgi:hypothetical protein